MLHDPNKGRISLEELDEISEAAFREARAAHRRKGVPLVFVREGRTLWELPDGTITDVNPFAKDASAEGSLEAKRDLPEQA